jgi:chromosome segregation protein
LICRSQPTGALAVGNSRNGNSEPPGEVLQDARVLGRLRDRLKLKAQTNGVIADRIGDAVLVDSLRSALDLHRLHPKADYLTPDGEVVYASGVITAGVRGEGDEGLLAHRRRVEEVRVEVAEASTQAATKLESVESDRAEIVRMESALAEQKQALEIADRRVVELRHRVERTTDETERAERHAAVLGDELRELREEARALRSRKAELTDEAQLVEAGHEALERSLQERTALLEGREQEMKLQSESVAAARERHAVMRQRQEAADEESGRLAQQAAELDSRLELLVSEAADAESAAGRAQELLLQTERELLGQLESQKALAAAAQRMEREIGDERERLTQEELGLRSQRHELEQLRERTREVELERTRAESAREHLDDLCRQELGVSVTEALTLAAESDEISEDEPVDLAALEETIEEIKQKIERIGPVNMTAIEEFTELDERHGFLTAQKQDLDQSMESLKETIRRINRQSRERFLEAFESIRKSYQETYRLLFSGGRADLRLEEGEDVLECGIEILAQPPGKRLAGVHLLSGGEKALSAIALLFAIFRYQPSPFCLLDEVDAPLDDSNILRFTRMLSEYAKNTQFVMITHNKVSMEAAGVLYGVTMEEPGVSKLVSMRLH